MSIEKTSYVRSKKLLQASEGQSCVNCGAVGTVVGAHLQGIRAQSFGKGRGIKPHDFCVADLCARCHSKFDSYETLAGKNLQLRIDHSEQFMYCVLKTLERRFADGVINVK